ncbi:dienelactone hydrolase family protein [Ramlibacter sp. AW1]|uniref:Dienelactone hydrolase family protein n=1 Tax=Ramlibacter aurantiacus TaxID=2801330 RepID=A0A937D2E4_9BURK|nr:dienelactone hydrolase family protein [Ramlibacter aurantiacus]MBL0419660.1 dienelactone hydrolase family protein [Ramlibacter aurantiacus]
MDPRTTGTRQWVALPMPGGHMDVFVARPERPPGRAVVVLQEAFGVNANIQDIALRMAARGWLAVAPDLFHRTGPRELGYAEREEAMALISALDADAVTDDIRAVLHWLARDASVAPASVALLGFCFGGRAAFTAATALPDLGATVVFYGPGIAAGPHAVLARAPAITAPVQLHVGDQDSSIPVEQVRAIDQALSAAGLRFEQHVYPGAGHAFACEARPGMFRADAAALAWERSFEFLDRHVPVAA